MQVSSTGSHLPRLHCVSSRNQNESRKSTDYCSMRIMYKSSRCSSILRLCKLLSTIHQELLEASEILESTNSKRCHIRLKQRMRISISNVKRSFHHGLDFSKVQL